MKSEPASTDGIAIRRYRKHCGLRINELAELVGISSQHLGNIERGRRQGSPSLVLKISQSLGVPVDQITIG
jgi:transcriptional regulator with XRE-family HTH domain